MIATPFHVDAGAIYKLNKNLKSKVEAKALFSISAINLKAETRREARDPVLVT
jgi:hypothetical protein